MLGLVIIADTMGIFTGGTASCLLVRAGWQAGMLGSGMVLCISSLANGQSSMPQVLSWEETGTLCKGSGVLPSHALKFCHPRP